jgi:hypothetical protein
MPRQQTREIATAGSHLGVCYQLVELGTQPTEFQGQSGKRPQLRFTFELRDQLLQDGHPMAIGRTYTYSSDPRATLRQDIEGWLGRPLTEDDFGELDLAERIGCTAVLGVKHELGRNGREYANLASIMRPPASVMERMPPINPPLVFSLAAFDRDTYDALPEWMRGTIAKSPEYQAIIRAAEPLLDDPLPTRLKKRLQPPAGRPETQAVSQGDDIDDDIPF